MTSRSWVSTKKFVYFLELSAEELIECLSNLKTPAIMSRWLLGCSLSKLNSDGSDDGTQNLSPVIGRQ